MATISFEELLAVSDKFITIPTGRKPEKPSGQSSHVEYKFMEAVKTPIYQVRSLGQEEILTIFKKRFTTKVVDMTEEQFFETILVALNIRDPLDTTKLLVAANPYVESELCEDFKSAVPSKTSKVSFAPSFRTDLFETSLPVPSAAQPMETPEVEGTQEKITAICFLAAWMTRFAVKSPGDQLHLQLASVKNTFLKMYGRSSDVFNEFNPTKEYLTAIQNCYQSFPRARCTLAMNVGHMETTYKQVPKPFNVLRYCFFQHLEFMGMHAYTSTIQIINKLSIPVPLVLTWLRMNGMEDAVDEIGDIITRFDNGMLENGMLRERLWKYARMLNDGYFNKMQTSYNPELIATLSWIEIKLGLAIEDSYNSPLNIQAIKNNEEVLKVGKERAAAFLTCKNTVVSNQAGASVVDKIYAATSNLDIRMPAMKRPRTEAPKPTGEPPAKQPFIPQEIADLDI